MSVEAVFNSSSCAAHTAPSSPLKRKRSCSFAQPLRSHIHHATPRFLLALPALLALSPTHPHHIASLRLSLLAVRRCLQLKDNAAASMTPELECRAWAAFVELGMRVVGAGLSGQGTEGEEWARGLENEIGVAIGKGLSLAQKHPSLYLYIHHLTLQHAQLAHWQHNHRFARTLLRRRVAALSSADPQSHYYSTHLTLVSLALAANPVDVPSALHSLSAIQSLSERWGHSEVGLLSQVIRLRALVSSLRWTEVFPLLNTIEPILDLVFPEAVKPLKPNSQPKPMSTGQLRPLTPTITPLGPVSLNTPHTTSKPTIAAPASKSEFRSILELHVLTLGVLAHVQAGHSADASKRITRLHAVLDSGVLDREGIRDGVVEIPMNPSVPGNAPLYIYTTHPRVFFHLAFLVSAVAMRDATGRRPKGKVFAVEGLAVCERERPKQDHRPLGRYMPWTGLRVRQDVEERLAKIEADLLCELIGISVQRSEFEEAEKHLARLIAHARTHQLWDTYSARVTLYHAHLAHALCKPDRALECYRAAALLAGKEERSGRMKAGGEDGKVHAGVAVARFVRVAAQAGQVGLLIGRARSQTGVLDDAFKKWGSDIAKECRALGGSLEVVGRIIEACLTEEIVVAKDHLKASLNLTSHALDNHLRALVLALASSHYLYTSPDYAELMLTTARQIAAGLGAPASKSQDPQHRLSNIGKGPRKVGNVPLGLWVGQRFQDLYRRTGRDKRARQQEAINTELTSALMEIELRGRADGASRASNNGDMQLDQ